MKSPAATPERVKETEINVQEEVWKFIAAALKQCLRRLLEGLLEDKVTAKVNARKYERSSRRQRYRSGNYLNEELRQYQTKPLADNYPFLFLDGITQKVREIGVKKKVMLCAWG